MDSKVLVVTLSDNAYGGVVEFNKLLFKYAQLKLNSFKLNSGARNNKFISFILLITDYLRFAFYLSVNRIEVIHVNPSLAKNSIIRDGIFVLFSKLFGKKVYVHWHGWDEKKEYLLKAWYLKFTFFRADHIRFLSKNFEKKFKDLGYLNSSSVGKTFFDDDILKLNLNKSENRTKRLLFLSTLSKNKGIYEALNLFMDINNVYNLKLIIAGKGPEEPNIINIIQHNNLTNIEMVGFVSGEDKYSCFLNSDIYLFPSYYEGMPTSVLEAMAFGLPIVCSKVGALPEIFHNGINGFMVDDLGQLKSYVEKLLNDDKLRERIGENNRRYAEDYFRASVVVSDIENEYLSL